MNLRYTTPGKARSPLAILARIDYLGSLALLLTVGCTLFGLSFRFNRDRGWSEPSVWGNFVAAAVGGVFFVVIELWVAVEPVLARALLRMRVPLLVAISSLLVSLCAFAVTCESCSCVPFARGARRLTLLLGARSQTSSRFGLKSWRANPAPRLVSSRALLFPTSR